MYKIEINGPHFNEQITCLLNLC